MQKIFKEFCLEKVVHTSQHVTIISMYVCMLASRNEILVSSDTRNDKLLLPVYMLFQKQITST